MINVTFTRNSPYGSGDGRRMLQLAVPIVPLVGDSLLLPGQGEVVFLVTHRCWHFRDPAEVPPTLEVEVWVSPC